MPSKQLSCVAHIKAEIEDLCPSTYYRYIYNDVASNDFAFETVLRGAGGI